MLTGAMELGPDVFETMHIFLGVLRTRGHYIIIYIPVSVVIHMAAFVEYVSEVAVPSFEGVYYLM